ncbi:MAG: rhodanese-like domain-containing protein [Flavobacteriales bacterium]|nr:rhodanese-like domain-containing protein [Flavobacteriales bacterium]MCB9168676.1 rhodanese-like domain-containing protein [Flavobacteriales bacterium]
MKEIDVHELKRMRDAGEPHQLIDVREPYEAEETSMGGELIPMGEVLGALDRIRRDVPVVVHCRSGNRSRAVVEALSERHGLTNLINLQGGITAWTREIATGS